MSRIPLFFLLILLAACSSAKHTKSDASNDFSYHYEVDLNSIEEDKLWVKLTVNDLSDDKPIFCFPKMVPGIYGAMDFGQYIESLTALDNRGKALTVKQIDTNCWQIDAPGKAIGNITYQVNDTWEAFNMDVDLENVFYRSAGSSFQDSMILLNNNCIFGFFDGLEGQAFDITINRPDFYFPATGLPLQNAAKGKDHIYTQNYAQLVDGPILYSIPDTAIIHLDDIEVMVATHSVTDKPIAKEIADFITPLLNSQRKYLGGQLPVDKYSFLLHHNLSPNEYSYMADGLEHANSTIILFCMPLDRQVIKENVYGIASHEFFHIIMPIGLHSEELEYYDFANPKQSKHLWLYEGTTEYFSIHMPVVEGLHGMETFISEVERKYKEMQDFDNSIPLTALSLNAMEQQDQYYNFYLKGTLVNLCLDILLRETSNGEYGIQDLIRALLQDYGPGKPFKDEELFDTIVKKCDFASKEVKTFIEQYIETGQAPPLKSYLEKVGFQLNEEEQTITQIKSITPLQASLRKDWIGK